LSDELKKETGLNSRVEYPIIDKCRFKKEISGENVRRRYNLGKSPIILFVGRVSPHKGVHILIESFKLAKKKIGNLKLIIVGKLTFSGYYKRLMKIAEDFSNDIIFTGVVSDSDLPEYYSACNVYASASLWEGYNLPLAEAQACGKPVIAFNLCSHPEVVKNGILVKPRELREFADAIVRLLKK
jgi:1,2-diacylglycerol 3-alpha-glucosyltransferase